MKFIVEFRLKPGMKNKAVEAFEQRGPGRNPGVSFGGAWIGKQSEIAFVLIEAEDEARVVKAAESWASFGEPHIYPVVDVQQY